jgi:hypothetical protein
MKNSVYFIFLGFILVNFTYAQESTFNWGYSFGNPDGSDEGLQTAIDNENNIYVGGYYLGEIDFDPGLNDLILSSNGGWDVFIAKYNADGALIFAKSIGGPGEDYLTEMTIDNNGSVIVIGYFEGMIDIDPGSTYLPLVAQDFDYNSFVLKLDTNGDYVNAFSTKAEASKIICDNLGNVLLAGSFQNEVDFDPGDGVYIKEAVGLYDIYILKLDNQLLFEEVTTLNGNSSLVSISGLAYDNTNNIYLTGIFFDSMDFNINGSIETISSNGDQEIFILKISSSGELIFAKKIGGIGSEYGSSLSIDELSNYYISGYFQGTVDFDPGAGNNSITPEGLNAIFLAKYDSLGNYLKVLSLGGVDGWNSSFGMDINDEGDIWVTGIFESTIDFDPGPGEAFRTSNGAADIFLAHYDTEFNYVDAVTVGDSEYDYGYSCAISTEGDVYITGSFSLAADFDPGEEEAILSSTGYEDIFLAKYTTTPVGTFQPAATDSSHDLSIFPNPASEEVILRTGTAFQEAEVKIFDMSGLLICRMADRSGESLRLNIKDLPNGIYLIEVREHEENWRGKMVVGN